ncbi:hypothetical protein C427_2563 [Paraglaciecola psychrophila 170]|uniref:Uncharacterized protein n=1 Tax=Paraglaciecola psychrophila 170 TaxID=1129794 RepID=K6ZMM3_9ALTE|nr:hypothetical protein C427_2563 [Paraglaciecola psychrophila 170]GAC37206.1 hypothetical protein GPSY_1574 [Paraglaciecola psychrophila 170]
MNNIIDIKEHKGLNNKTILKVTIIRVVSLTFNHLSQATCRLVEKTIVT